MTKWIIVILIVLALIGGFIYVRGMGAENTGPETDGELSTDPLTNSEWLWVRAEEDGVTTEAASDRFVLQFSEDGRASSTTDCNSMSGQYTRDGEEIEFDNFVSTLMYCEDSQEGAYAAFLEEVESFEISGNELRLFFDDDREGDDGVMVFTGRARN